MYIFCCCFFFSMMHEINYVRKSKGVKSNWQTLFVFFFSSPKWAMKKKKEIRAST